jgi:hypothetical protein
MQRIALAELDPALHEFHGDVRSVYLTGISMGGFEVAKRGCISLTEATIPLYRGGVAQDGDTMKAALANFRHTEYSVAGHEISGTRLMRSQSNFVASIAMSGPLSDPFLKIFVLLILYEPA